MTRVRTNAESFCPLCKSNNNILLHKNHIALFKCRECGIIFNNTYQNIDYNDDYFLGQYKEQYGKTYIEDFDNIYAASLRRIQKILQLKRDVKITGYSLLDIGSAMGFFLKAALDSGIKDVLGVEVSVFASKYCLEKLKINVINSSFSNISLKKQFDIISAWYFVEHSYDPLSVFRKIFDLLNTNGVFAFSIPSFFGPQYSFNRAEWFKMHPVDHRINFSPVTVKKFLKRLGFKKIFIFPGGIHPERIISENSVFYKPFTKVYSACSGLVSFSDTIEIFALK